MCYMHLISISNIKLEPVKGIAVLELEYNTVYSTVAYIEVLGVLLAPDTRRVGGAAVCSGNISGNSTLQTCSFTIMSSITLHLRVRKQISTV